MTESYIEQEAEDQLRHALEWDWGTAYEMLLSLDTLFRPKVHGVPAPWAAGVRKRLPAQSQADLKAFFGTPFGMFTYTPLHLVMNMSGTKDVLSFLDFVEAIPDDEFSRRVHVPLVGDSTLVQIIRRALEGARATDAEVEEYRRA